MRWGIALLTASVRRATARASPLSLQRNDGPWEFDLAPASADDIVPLDAPSLGASPSPKLTVVWAPGHTLGSVVAHYTSAARGEGVLFSGHLVGGARTAAHAALLSEAFAAEPPLADSQTGCAAGTAVVAVPASMDGAFRNEFVESSVGFDTACKVYSQLIGNVQTDALSNKKYWYVA